LSFAISSSQLSAFSFQPFRAHQQKLTADG